MPQPSPTTQRDHGFFRVPDERPLMYLVHDYPVGPLTAGASDDVSSWRVRVFESKASRDDVLAALVVVVLTLESSSTLDEGLPVEVIAAEVLVRFGLPSSRTVFVEHRTNGGVGRPDTFEFLDFERDGPEFRELPDGRFARALEPAPIRRPLSPALIENLLARGQRGSSSL